MPIPPYLLTAGHSNNITAAADAARCCCLVLLLMQVAKLLVDAGADMDIPWKKGKLLGVPPLLYAAQVGSIRIIEALVGEWLGCLCYYYVM